jgi:hypothetical protein
MGFLNFFKKSQVRLLRLPTGSFTVDANGRLLTSTLPQAFPQEVVNDIATQVLTAFRSAQSVQLPLSEVVIRYSCLKLTARELGGGAIIFLSPQNLISVNP